MSENELEAVVDEVVVDEVVADEVTEVPEESVEGNLEDDSELTPEMAMDIIEEDSDEPDEEPDEEPEEVSEEVSDETPEEEAKADEPTDEEFLATISNERTRERFQKLTHSNKELVEKFDTQDKIISNFRTQIETTGLNNQEIASAFDIMAKANSSNFADLQEARKFFQNIEKSLSERIGDVPDAYQQHSDLKEAYEDGDMTEEWANNEAKRRAEDNMKKDILHKQEYEAGQDREEQAYIEGRANEIQSMAEEWSRTDPNFKAKEPAFMKIIQSVAKEGLSPEAWLPVIKERYNALSTIPSRRRTSTPMSAGYQGRSVSNYSSSNLSDADADRAFAMNEIFKT